MGSGPGAEPHAVHRLYVAAEGVTSIKENMTLSLRVRERSGDNCRMMEEEEAIRVQALCKEHGATFLLDDRVELVKKLNADVVFLFLFLFLQVSLPDIKFVGGPVS